MVRVVMLSPPGAGKGTHGRWLTQQTGAAHISSGDLLRAEVARGFGLGRQIAAYTARGDLVPDDLIFSIFIPAVVAAARDTGVAFAAARRRRAPAVATTTAASAGTTPHMAGISTSAPRATSQRTSGIRPAVRIAATFWLVADRHQPTKARRLSLREPIVARTAVGS